MVSHAAASHRVVDVEAAAVETLFAVAPAPHG